ncbi:peptidylprolyl isomerase [Mariniblastus sp.]|nr:peptidylprolyl isomerase [Mariniblastus sp.]
MTITVTDAFDATVDQTFAVAVGSLRDIDPSARNGIYPAAPGNSIDTTSTFDAVLDTDVGEITIRLLDDESPAFVNNFVSLARDGFYDGLVFHRVIDGFVAQSGDPLGTGGGGPGFQIPDEVGNTIPFDSRGQLSFANSGNDTTGSQFFITFGSTGLSTNQFSVFGNVTAGDDVLDQIVRMFTINPIPRSPDIPIGGATPTVVNSITIVETQGESDPIA